MSEKTRRAVYAADAVSLGRGGISLVSSLSGVSRVTLHAGVKELMEKRKLEDLPTERVRKEGGGRKKKSEVEEGLVSALEKLVNPHTLGDPMQPLLYTSRSLRNLATELNKLGYDISHRVVGEILKSQGYTLQANRKTHEGGDHPDRDKQFDYINKSIKKFFRYGDPVVSVDFKKKELVGNFKNNGTEWAPKREAIDVEAYDFINLSDGESDTLWCL